MRVRVVVLIVLITGSLAWVGSQALSGNLVYYVTPTELLQRHPAPNERLRLGGQVVPGSVLIRQGAQVGRPSELFVEAGREDGAWRVRVGGGVHVVGRGTFEL